MSSRDTLPSPSANAPRVTISSSASIVRRATGSWPNMNLIPLYSGGLCEAVTVAPASADEPASA